MNDDNTNATTTVNLCYILRESYDNGNGNTGEADIAVFSQETFEDKDKLSRILSEDMVFGEKETSELTTKGWTASPSMTFKYIFIPKEIR